MFTSLHDRALTWICGRHGVLCLQTVISGSVPKQVKGFPWQFLIQCYPRARRLQATGVNLSHVQRDVFRFSESLIILCTVDYRIIRVFTILHLGALFWNSSIIFWFSFFADCLTSSPIYFWETLPLEGALFLPLPCHWPTSFKIGAVCEPQ